MKNPLLKAPLILNAVIFIVSSIISLFSLMFGVAHLYEGIKRKIEGTSSNIPFEESVLGLIMVALLCIIGVVALLLAVASAKALFNRVKK